MQRWHGFPLGLTLLILALVLAARVTTGTGGGLARIGAAVFVLLGMLAFVGAFSEE
ncbi:MAG TPA: hypothetical protein VFW18_07040 [Gaiellales bacterium]|nr:hypothetical protein [Gaiellales bacterium]